MFTFYHCQYHDLAEFQLINVNNPLVFFIIVYSIVSIYNNGTSTFSAVDTIIVISYIPEWLFFSLPWDKMLHNLNDVGDNVSCKVQSCTSL